MKQKWLKKVLALGLGCVMTVGMLAGCGGSDSSSGSGSASGDATPAEGGEITIGVTSFADTLEPTEQYFSWVVSRYGVGECLARFDTDGTLVPCLATDWKGSEDGLT